MSWTISNFSQLYLTNLQRDFLPWKSPITSWRSGGAGTRVTISRSGFSRAKSSWIIRLSCTQCSHLVGGFSSLVALQLHKLETPLGFSQPITSTNKEYLEGAGLLTWLGLDWLVSLLGLVTQAELDLCKSNRTWPQGTVALHKDSVFSGSY